MRTYRGFWIDVVTFKSRATGAWSWKAFVFETHPDGTRPAVKPARVTHRHGRFETEHLASAAGTVFACHWIDAHSPSESRSAPRFAVSR